MRPVLLVNRIVRRWPQRRHKARVGPRSFLLLAGREEHDVVGVHEVDRQQPGLIQLLAVAHQPLAGFAGHHAVGDVALPHRAVHVPGQVVVAETIGLQGFAPARVAAVHQPRAILDIRQMPFALVGGVVAQVLEKVAQGRQFLIEARKRRCVQVGGHTGAHGVLAAVHHRPRRRAGRGIDVILIEAGAAIQQLLVGREIQPAGQVHPGALLVGHQQQHIGPTLLAQVDAGFQGRRGGQGGATQGQIFQNGAPGHFTHWGSPGKTVLLLAGHG